MSQANKSRAEPLEPAELPADRTQTVRLPPGKKLGRYDLVFELGSGGMASVYLARSTGPHGFEKPVALKCIHPHLARRRDFVAMFRDEAKLSSRIQHPGLCPCFDFGEADGTYFFAMEFVMGETFAALLRRLEASTEPVSWPRYIAVVARLIGDACEGLHAAHELRGDDGRPLDVVHRDVTPRNLFVSYDGTVRVVDFGVAYALGRDSHTRTGTLKGTPAYIAPELLRGESADRRADVWSVGVVLYEMLTGARLFKRQNDIETIQAVERSPIIPPSEILSAIPKELDAIVLKALARDRNQRFSTARELSLALHGFARHRGYAAHAADVEAFLHELFPGGYAERLRMIEEARRGSDFEDDGATERIAAARIAEALRLRDQQVRGERPEPEPSFTSARVAAAVKALDRMRDSDASADRPEGSIGATSEDSTGHLGTQPLGRTEDVAPGRALVPRPSVPPPRPNVPPSPAGPPSLAAPSTPPASGARSVRSSLPPPRPLPLAPSPTRSMRPDRTPSQPNGARPIPGSPTMNAAPQPGGWGAPRLASGEAVLDVPPPPPEEGLGTLQDMPAIDPLAVTEPAEAIDSVTIRKPSTAPPEGLASAVLDSAPTLPRTSNAPIPYPDDTANTEAPEEDEAATVPGDQSMLIPSLEERRRIEEDARIKTSGRTTQRVTPSTMSNRRLIVGAIIVATFAFVTVFSLTWWLVRRSAMPATPPTLPTTTLPSTTLPSTTLPSTTLPTSGAPTGAPTGEAAPTPSPPIAATGAAAGAAASSGSAAAGGPAAGTSPATSATPTTPAPPIHAGTIAAAVVADSMPGAPGAAASGASSAVSPPPGGTGPAPVAPTARPLANDGDADDATAVRAMASVTMRNGWAEVFFHNRPLGRTPLRASLPVGRVTLAFRPFGRQGTVRQAFTVRDRAPNAFTLDTEVAR